MAEIIYIDGKNKYDASVAANTFADKNTKNRAYINTLGAELCKKYLASENIDTNNIYSIHSIKKIIEELDISDIILPNIHIDVRVVFDENAIFIPKSHFEYDILPDIYVVFNLAKDFSSVSFLGFFDSKLINPNNANKDYYFIEKEKLTSPLELKNYIENFKGNKSEQISEDEIFDCERFIISMADNDISNSDKKHLINMLTKSAELRDKFIEYENFESLSYKAVSDNTVTKRDIPFNEDITDFDAINENEEAIIGEVIDDGFEDFENQQDTISEIQDEVLDITKSTVLDTALDEIPQEFTELSELSEFSEIENTENIDGIGSEDIVNNTNEIVDLEEFDIPANISEELSDTENLIDTNELTDIEDLSQQIGSDEIIETENILGNDIEEETPVNSELFNMEDIHNIDNFEEINVDDEIETFDIENSATKEEFFNEDTETFNTSYNLETSDIEINDENSSDTIQEDTNEQFSDISDISDITENSELGNTDETENYGLGNAILNNLTEEEIEITQASDLKDEKIASSELIMQIDDLISSSSEATEESEENPSDENFAEEENEFNNTFDDSITYDEKIYTDESQKDEKLEILFNDDNNEQDSSVMEELDDFQADTDNTDLITKPTHKKSLVVATVLIATLIGVGIYLKPKNNNSDIEPISKTSTNDENILESNIPSDSVQTPNIPKENIQKKVEDLNNIQSSSKTSSSPVLEVKRLVWDVPNSLSYRTKMQNYLRTAGKSIKLSLSADLLLATEYAYTNQVKIGLNMSKDGSVQSSSVILSSGSSQIDNIVLQSVKDTLNVVKPPVDEIKTQDYNLSLIIYF